jgi:ADP-ribose pyrophosphatase
MACPDANGHARRHAPWEVLASREVYASAPWISVNLQQVRLPDGRVVSDYHHIHLSDYTVIFAETTDGRVVVERQYKHGVGAVSLMLPAGRVEPGEPPLKSAQRELLEETGYAAEDWQSLGCFVPNANYGCGLAHFFTARNARQVAEPDSGDLEAMDILLLTRAELLEALRSGEIRLTSMAAAIAMATHPRLNPTVVPHG